MMKFYHNEFQSDIFLLLEAFHASILLGNYIKIIYILVLIIPSFVLVNVDDEEFFVSPKDFLKVDMKKTVIKNIILKAFDDSYKFASFKVSRFV